MTLWFGSEMSATSASAVSTHENTDRSIGWPDASFRFQGMNSASGEDAALQAAPITSETNWSADEKATKMVWVIPCAPGIDLERGKPIFNQKW